MKNMSNHHNDERPPPEGLAKGRFLKMGHHRNTSNTPKNVMGHHRNTSNTPSD